MLVPRISGREAVLSLLLGFALAFICCAAWIGWRYLETKSMACECEDPVDSERFSQVNPFRDRGPERAADEFFREVQSGKCREFTGSVPYCERESRFKIVSWNPTGRVSYADGSVGMRYWVLRTEGQKDSFGDPVWVDVQRSGESWKVDGISLYY